VRAPKANAICERFIGSMRRECLDHLIILSEQQLYRLIGEYVTYFNHARPHQGLGRVSPSHLPMATTGSPAPGRWSLIPCWVACITTTGVQPDRLRSL
jgi:putative transposase